MLLFAETPEENTQVAAWVAERIPHVAGGHFGPCQCAGVVRGDYMIAGVVFHDWQPGPDTLQLSMAADTPMWSRPEVLSGLFRYAFVTNGAQLLWTATPIDNDKALKFNLHIGMKREAVLRHRFGHKRHAVICSMTRGEWTRSRWHSEA